MDDSLPDEHLFSIVVQTPSYVDIANYLVSQKVSSHFSPKER